ncbi:hypothetical protein [Draconibacterium orientale]|uniref:hypothetical protein n=1 Tax=Draconibacterium orientale TaxID=1168034 RepID=UPI002A0A6DBA|nr:hypothetical protein [Draconibacterium orientale]
MEAKSVFYGLKHLLMPEMPLSGAKLQTYNTYKIFGRPAKKADRSQMVLPDES